MSGIDEIRPEHFNFSLEENIDYPEFLGEMYDCLKDTLAYKEKIGVANGKFTYTQVDGEPKSKYSEAWKLGYVDGFPVTEIMRKLRGYGGGHILSNAVFYNTFNQGGWIAIYRELIAPYSALIACKDRFFPDDEVWKLSEDGVGPNIINTRDGTWVAVKVRSRFSTEPIDSMLPIYAKSHIQAGNPFKMVVIKFATIRCQIEIWDVSR